MFEGSKNVPEGAFDNWLEAAGGNNNGSTTTDRTNYYIDIPSNALELALFLESDRMGYLLDTMTPARVDGQRDVVKNERRQSYENQPVRHARSSSCPSCSIRRTIRTAGRRLDRWRTSPPPATTTSRSSSRPTTRRTTRAW